MLNVPIVASDVGGAAQVLAGSANSQPVGPGDNSALAQAVRGVLNNVRPFSEVFPDRATELTRGTCLDMLGSSMKRSCRTVCKRFAQGEFD